MIDFPSPILSVSPEVVRDLEGEDALYGMWTGASRFFYLSSPPPSLPVPFFHPGSPPSFLLLAAFSIPCSLSTHTEILNLKDGRRLENMSWRLWYREMTLSAESLALSSSASSSSGSPALSSASSQTDFFAASNTSQDSLTLTVPPTAPTAARHSWHGTHLPPPLPTSSNIRRLSTASMPARPHNVQGQRAGSIIVGILPDTLDVIRPGSRLSSNNNSSPNTTADNANDNVGSIWTPITRTTGLSSGPSTAKPSPAAGTTFVHRISVAQPRPVLGTPPASTALLGAPRVVVVNPTPCPSPPASPHTELGPVGRLASPSPSLTSTSTTSLTSASSLSLSSEAEAGVVVQMHGQHAAAYPEQGQDREQEQQGQKGVDDDTLKPSDCRFFLRSHSHSPDGDGESPERPPPTVDEPVSPVEQPEPSVVKSASDSGLGVPTITTTSPATTTTNTTTNNAPAHAPRRNTSKTAIGRRGRDVPRFTSTTSTTSAAGAGKAGGGGKGAQRPGLGRRVTDNRERERERREKMEREREGDGRSVSSNGTNGAQEGRKNKGDKTKERKEVEKREAVVEKVEKKAEEKKVEKKPVVSPPALAPAPALVLEAARKAKGLVMSGSSEYTTDTEDDSEWASEDGSGDSERDKKGKGVQKGQDKGKGKEQESDKSKEKEKTQKAQDKTQKAAQVTADLARKAAEEAQRQRDMFAKMPKRSYTDLSRTKSGLLSQLMNPDPMIFPPDHPYRQRHSMSTQDVTQFGKGVNGGPRFPQQQQQQPPVRRAMPLRAMMTPMNALVAPTNGSVSGKMAGPGGSGSGNGNGSGNGYRPKGRPLGEEMETDTEEENGENGLGLSRSLAQQKLAQLAGPSRRRVSDQQGAPSGLLRSRMEHEFQQQQLQQQYEGYEGYEDYEEYDQYDQYEQPPMPIPLGHPYNLPAPLPPSTPGTLRRSIISAELSESLRRNLLWERHLARQAQNVAAAAARRRAAIAEMRGPVDPVEEARRAAVARNRSWADDYHSAGW
ncbi:hypothetical protein BDW22DRAFT_1433473 [Trametopsis cervina]|nr:hypothetical protein BDW22DRAFT_1433473 [Trametopsis cervina]